MDIPGGSVGKSLLEPQEIQETWVRSLGWEDALEEEMVTHSSILARKTPWTREADGARGATKSWTRLKPLSTHTLLLVLSLTVSEPPSLVHCFSRAFNITAHISRVYLFTICLPYWNTYI